MCVVHFLACNRFVNVCLPIVILKLVCDLVNCLVSMQFSLKSGNFVCELVSFLYELELVNCFISL